MLSSDYELGQAREIEGFPRWAGSWAMNKVLASLKTKTKKQNPDTQEDFQEGPAISMEISPKFEWA